VAVLGERVFHHRREGFLLAAQRDDLAADGIGRVVGVDQAQEVGRDVDPKLVRRAQALALLLGQVEHLLDIGQVVDPVGKLPAPVVPLLVGHVQPARRAAADRWPAVRAKPECRIAAVDEGFVGDGDVRAQARQPPLAVLAATAYSLCSLDRARS
jgi:hypothetical protein